MQRSIASFRTDEEGDWIAVLTCGHGQHVRHRPPFELRPWVVTAEGRREKVGQSLECLRCDRLEIPEGYVCRTRTPTFSETTVPSALLTNHRLKPSTWGRIVLEQGALDCLIDAKPPQAPRRLTIDRPGVIPPEVVHRIALPAAARFHVEFWSAPDTETSGMGYADADASECRVTVPETLRGPLVT